MQCKGQHYTSGIQMVTFTDLLHLQFKCYMGPQQKQPVKNQLSAFTLKAFSKPQIPSENMASHSKQWSLFAVKNCASPVSYTHLTLPTMSPV